MLAALVPELLQHRGQTLVALAQIGELVEHHHEPLVPRPLGGEAERRVPVGELDVAHQPVVQALAQGVPEAVHSLQS